MESLPKQFVSAMRTLFDIMDEKKSGYVRLKDIEHRWRDDRTKGLPRGVVESLQKVASPEGLLTFDRFCTGLKICLLQNQVGETGKIENNNEDSKTSPRINMSVQSHRPPSAPMLDLDEHNKREKSWGEMKLDNISQHRTISMPVLARKDIQIHDPHHGMLALPQKPDPMNGVYGPGPPKPPRLEKSHVDRKEHSRKSRGSDEDAIYNNHLSDSKDFLRDLNISLNRELGDGRPNTDSPSFQPGPEVAVPRRVPRRREPRRHTLHNGVDYNLIKRMKQIEQEKDILLQGLAAVEEAREWYLKQLSEVQEKMRYAGRMGAYVEPWSEAQQERVELLRARVVELSRQVGALAGGRALSLHMNLALPAPPRHTRDNVVSSQNRMLIEEVNRKNDKIAGLEREKSSLIRELLLQRNRAKLIDTLN